MAGTVSPAHHACRAPLAIVEQHALPVLWVTLSILELAPNALLLHACDAITPLQPCALSATVSPISIQLPISVWLALVLAAAAKLPPSAQTVSMDTSCRPFTTWPLVLAWLVIPTVPPAALPQPTASVALQDHTSVESSVSPTKT